jgi:CHAT domain-containing protein/transcription antitermination factor NusG
MIWRKKVNMRNISGYSLLIVLLFSLQMKAQAIDSLNIYSKKEGWDQDIHYYEKAINDFNVNSQNEKEFAKLLKQVAFLYLNNGDIIKAEENLLKSYKIIEKIYSNDTEYYIDEIEGITKFYRFTNDLGKADSYAQIGYETALRINDDEKYLSFLAIKASIKYDLGDYENAYVLYLEGIPLAKKIYGEKSILYASLMGNMGDVMIRRNELENAKRCYLINYLVTYDLYGENHIETAIMLNKLSNIYIKLDNFKKALELNLRAHQIYLNLTGNSSLEYATSCYNLASTYAFIKDYENSEKYYLESYNIKTQIYGSESTNILNSLKSLIILYDKTNKLPDNTDLLIKYFVLIKHKIEEIESNFSQKELILLTESITKTNYTPNSFLQKNPAQYPEINIGCYENELLVKNISLRNQQLISKNIQKSDNAILKEKYSKFMSNKRQISKLNEIPLYRRPANFEQLSLETETLEKELVRESSAFSYAKNERAVNWNQIQEKLKPNEIAIDLVAFKYYNKKWTDSIVYSAFVVGKGYKVPKYIPLFEQKQLDFLLAKNKTQQTSSCIDKQYTDKAISDLFLKPLEKELEGISSIYLSPSGLGHQIDFSALPISLNHTLGEKYKVHILNSPAELIDYKVTIFDPKSNLELLLYGGIDFDKSNPQRKPENAIIESSEDISELTIRSGISGFGYLNGTNNEINQINLKARQNGFTTTVFKEREATEESIKQLDGRTAPYVLHLATHGFFFSDPKQESAKDIFTEQGKAKIYKASDDPMMRSGLLFAGANNYWGKPNENSTTDDGILTASEISNLDLSACQLVVLSACETGLGEIQGSEGVFGLQRAFKMAGVKNIIMSLWKVPDAQTAELFDIFYSECFSGKNIHEAFQSAQSKMKAKYSPYYWAGFVLLE